jgi:hypothetical protein
LIYKDKVTVATSHLITNTVEFLKGNIMPTKKQKPDRRGTVRITRTVVDGDTIGIKVTPVKPVMKVKKPKKS